MAAADRSVPEHRRCASLLQERDDVAITVPVAAESAWMIESRLGPRAEATFVSAIAEGELSLVELTNADWRRCAELIATYHDLGLGLVDASIVAVAERLGLTAIATLNHRDFTVVRPAHLAAFELLPS